MGYDQNGIWQEPMNSDGTYMTPGGGLGSALRIQNAFTSYGNAQRMLEQKQLEQHLMELKDQEAQGSADRSKGWYGYLQGIDQDTDPDEIRRNALTYGQLTPDKYNTAGVRDQQMQDRMARTAAEVAERQNRSSNRDILTPSRVDVNKSVVAKNESIGNLNDAKVDRMDQMTPVDIADKEARTALSGAKTTLAKAQASATALRSQNLKPSTSLYNSLTGALKSVDSQITVLASKLIQNPDMKLQMDELKAQRDKLKSDLETLRPGLMGQAGNAVLGSPSNTDTHSFPKSSDADLAEQYLSGH